jgi:hypothetical protein
VEVSLPVGRTVSRTLKTFNDTFSGTSIQVAWQIRAGSATGPMVDGQVLDMQVPLGAHVSRQITLTTPSHVETLYLILTASKPGQGRLFYDASTRFN